MSGTGWHQRIAIKETDPKRFDATELPDDMTAKELALLLGIAGPLEFMDIPGMERIRDTVLAAVARRVAKQ